MLKIQRSASGEVTFAVSGQLESDTLGELSALLALESSERAIVLELRDLVLADREALDFLRACAARGVLLRNCPAYIRICIESRRDQA
jgi:hypothetical protein